MVSAVNPGPKDMAQPGWPDCARAADLLQDKHDSGGRHVAKLRENIARSGERIGAEAEAFLNRIEDGAASGMHGPQVDGLRIAAARDLGARFLEGAADFAGDLAGEMHVEAEFADAPGDEVAGAREC